MKVVLFCGGLGTRLREHSDTIPKPLVPIGYRPILWHLMRYYAHFGHKDFILCLGYRGDLIREYFLNYEERISTDFVWSDSGRTTKLLGDDISDWTISFIDTGMHANIGERLVAVRDLVEGDGMFLANYADGLSNLPLDAHIKTIESSDSVAGFCAVRTSQSYHAVHCNDDGRVTAFGQLDESDFWINGGFFVFRDTVFDYIEPGDELVEGPFQRMIRDKKLVVTRHGGFWRSMDTFKDKIEFDREYARGKAPWELWKTANGGSH
jgi:glucose-1-phosphate cytidylyltransferase